MTIFLNVLIVVLIIVVILLALFFYLGRKAQKKQVQQQALLDAAAQTTSLLVIDKKKMKLKDANLPKVVYENTPKYAQRMKVPLVKVKIGPRIMTLMAEGNVFDQLPIKSEAKVVVSGIYITKVLSVRGGTIQQPQKKEGFFKRMRNKAAKSK